MLKSIAIHPPLAVARIGFSDTPCCAYSWSRDEISPDKPAVTSLRVEETLTLAWDGTISSSRPNEIVLKDEDGRYRPVCPFFELWGVWESNGQEVEGPITASVLDELGIELDDVVWTVTLANLKPYHVTLKERDRITARVRISGGDTAKKLLLGRSPNAGEPLVSHPDGIPMGAVQLSKADASFPELRLRFYAPAGAIYGPIGFRRRISDLIAARPDLAAEIANWLQLNLPENRERVNPRSGWATHNFQTTSVPPWEPAILA